MINTQNILLSDTFVQCEGNIASDMDGNKVMLNIQNGKYYNLGDVGGVIWDLLQSPLSVENIVAYLVESYEVEKEKCKKQVISFLKTLLNENLIKVVKS